ncbi:hypothetical protein EVAR_92930_1 [Eumeta japonica]|uniref:Uncharacterized protein n=1 Tax=Eumeta variegata TaxID=151549 RepID=A0A4C1TBB9_EUMVA|nr:hypothetical protein EVAR_92930_1 [Eumeta japonica]
MPKTNAENCREYRRKKREKKIKKVAKSSTQRVREFRARRKASRNVRQNSITHDDAAAVPNSTHRRNVRKKDKLRLSLERKGALKRKRQALIEEALAEAALSEAGPTTASIPNLFDCVRLAGKCGPAKPYVVCSHRLSSIEPSYTSHHIQVITKEERDSDCLDTVQDLNVGHMQLRQDSGTDMNIDLIQIDIKKEDGIYEVMIKEELDIGPSVLQPRPPPHPY